MDSDYKKYLGLTLKWLGRRPRSKKEVVDYLEKKSVPAALISQIITYLENYKLIGDQAFTDWLIESRSRSSPRGKRLLTQELKSKGITDADINIDEPALAFQALQKKLPLWQKLSFRDYRVKAARYLASRGFSWDVIDRVVKQAREP